MRRPRRYLPRLLAAGLVVLAANALTGCAQAPVGRGAATSAPAQAGDARVFGRIAYFVDGKQQHWGSGLFADGIAIALRSLDRDQVEGYRIKGDGSFAWSLPPGNYVIAAFRRNNLTGRLWVRFQVPPPGHARYIGELRIFSDKSRYWFDVRDDPAARQADGGAQAGAQAVPFDTALMQREARLGSYRDVWPICSARAGLPCGFGRHGVEPLLAGSASGHPQVDSRTPLLAWKPSDRAGITYDVAVYESVSLSSLSFGIGSQRGPLVAYAQNLREPRYRLPTPLAPGKSYDWSVRLRDGDTVSDWSTSGYLAFFVVGYVSQRGRWFGFSIPAAR